MPNKPSAAKALRQSIKKTVIHLKVKDELKRSLKRARRAVEAKSADAEMAVKEAARLIDRSIRKKILKKNAAARTKSRLVKLLQKRKS
ncbi:MAG: 30S ribosomal protein S20 [Patescibacteria group bacterium]|jgi:small subunit ribosomal protein S20